MNGSLWWIGYKTIVRKEITRILRIWGQTIVPPAITMSLYFIIFGELIGRRIGEMGGFTYMQYIVPGLVIMSVITNSYGNMVSSFFGAKFGKHIEELLISPLPELDYPFRLRNRRPGARFLWSGWWSWVCPCFSPGSKCNTR